MDYLAYAVDVALANTHSGHLPRMGAVLVTRTGWYDGFNKLKSHPLQARFGRRPGNIYLHAELDVIVHAARYGAAIEGASLYVARVLKNGQPALAKPCLGCQRAIMHFGISHVEWTT